MVGGATPSRTAITVATISSAPAAPSAWPIIDLVEDTASFSACVAEHLLQRLGLGLVVGGGAGAVRVDVLRCRPPPAGVVERALHGARHAADVGRGQVGGVRAHAEADDLGEDLRAARLRAVERFEHQMAAPSPSTMPCAAAENGRQTSGAITRIASQPRMVPKVMQASVPPVTAQSTMPGRTIWKAAPIACVAEAQALATAKAGPRSPQCIEIWLAGALTISFGMVNG